MLDQPQFYHQSIDCAGISFILTLLTPIPPRSVSLYVRIVLATLVCACQRLKLMFQASADGDGLCLAMVNGAPYVAGASIDVL